MAGDEADRIRRNIGRQLSHRRPSRDVVIAAYQAITREWWRDAADRFQLVASELVRSEAGAGDPDAARARLEALETVTAIGVTAEAETLARSLLDSGAVPRKVAADAVHIAVAAANGVDYMVTWNLLHIANAVMRARIERACRRSGYEPPVICTPNELLEADDADDPD